MSLYGHIRHDAIRRSILAYLATHDEPVKAERIVKYMQLMHYTERENVAAALMYATHVGVIIQTGYAQYQRRWEIVQ